MVAAGVAGYHGMAVADETWGAIVPGIGGPLGPRHAWRSHALAVALHGRAPAGPLLDAGCGRGTCGAVLSGWGRVVAACDLAPRVRPPVRARCEALPFNDAAFAGVALGEVLEHLEDDVAALREIRRVMTPGGVVVITVPAGPGRLGRLDRLVGHQRRYTRRSLATAVEATGLRVETIRGWGWPFGRVYDALRQHVLAVEQPIAAPRRRAAAEALWLVLFRLEARLDARDAGSGLIAVARRP